MSFPPNGFQTAYVPFVGSTDEVNDASTRSLLGRPVARADFAVAIGKDEFNWIMKPTSHKHCGLGPSLIAVGSLGGTHCDDLLN